MRDERDFVVKSEEVGNGTRELEKNGWKPFIVATNTSVTCVCVAGSEEEAINNCKKRFEDEHGYDVEGWTAYTFDEYFSDVIDPSDDLVESVLLLQTLM